MKKSSLIFAGIIGLFVGLSSTVSCVDRLAVGDAFLDKAPGVDVSIDTIFGKAENTRYFLWNLYNHIACPFYDKDQIQSSPNETLSDIYHAYSDWSGAFLWYYPGTITEAGQAEGHDKFRFNTSGSKSRSIYDGIRKGWILVENMDRVPDMTPEEKSRLKGEAYVIMATRYMDGLKNFGGIPIVDHAYETGEQFHRGRATVEETVNFIDSLLQCAIAEPYFPWRLDDVDNEAGRITKAAAYGLRAKLYMYAASPLFNDTEPYMQFTRNEEGQDIHAVWYGGYKPELWTKCVEACEDFFKANEANGGYYKLVQPATRDFNGYSDAFRAAYWTRGNEEKLLEVHPTYKMEEWGDQHWNGFGNIAHQGHLNPTMEYMEMFPMADGRNYPYTDESGVYNTNNPENIDIFVDRDPRLYETMLVQVKELREDYNGKKSWSMWQGGDVYHSTSSVFRADRLKSGICLFKWIRDFKKMKNEPVAYAYLRMADMHLIYAEALAETGKLQEACDQVNLVRDRVGLGKIEVMNPGLNLTSNKANLIKEIMRERACELGLEDERLYDIIRRKEVDKFTSPLHEIVIWRKTAEGEKDTRSDTRLASGDPYPNFIYDKQVITYGARRWWEPGFWTNKWFLSPFPRTEINKNYGLFQNPGW